MGRCTSLVMRLTWIAALVALWLNCVFALAEPTLWPPHNPGACCPNARNYGYNETQWRVWPGEGRPERVFPAAVGREIMPPTAGQVPLPLPKAEAAPSKTESPAGALPSQTPGGQVLPEPAVPSGKPTSDEDLLTPNKLLPGMGILPGKPEKPAETPLNEPEKPSFEKDLPGLGPEATPPAKSSEPKAGSQPAPSPSGKSDDLVPVRPEKKPHTENESDQPPPETEKPASPKAPPPSGAGIETDSNCPIIRTSAVMPFDGGQPLAENRAASAVLEVPVSPAPALAAPASTAILSPAPIPPAQAPPHTAEFCEAASGGDPPLILDGFCVVELSEHQRWVRGDARCPAVYAGRTFLFSGQEQRLRFLSNPARYTPACGGNDPVLATERNANVPGKCEFSTLCDGKVYLFASVETLARFRQSPYRYVTQGR